METITDKNISSYPEPYFSRKELDEEYEKIFKSGFEPDAFLSTQPDLPVYGLNLAIGWPFPELLKNYYTKLSRALAALGPDVYVYPYSQTHITIMTLVNFKKNQRAEQEFKKLVPKIINLISIELSLLNFQTFKIDIGPPVLLKRAAILPILNHRKEICRLREKIAPLLRNSLNLQVEIPRSIHSTILRFLKRPPNEREFIKKFESIAANLRLGEASINELLLTSEIKPYMRGGEKLYCFSLIK